MPWYHVDIEVTDILESGTCNYGHKVGDSYSTMNECRGVCSAAFHTLYPYIVALRSGGSLPWEDDPEVAYICCPDHKNPVVFKLTRNREDDTED
ncbi:MAG: TIGR04076 family protein [Promethearchaeota archaeon]